MKNRSGISDRITPDMTVLDVRGMRPLFRFNNKEINHSQEDTPCQHLTMPCGKS